MMRSESPDKRRTIAATIHQIDLPESRMYYFIQQPDGNAQRIHMSKLRQLLTSGQLSRETMAAPETNPTNLKPLSAFFPQPSPSVKTEPAPAFPSVTVTWGAICLVAVLACLVLRYCLFKVEYMYSNLATGEQYLKTTHELQKDPMITLIQYLFSIGIVISLVLYVVYLIRCSSWLRRVAKQLE